MALRIVPASEPLSIDNIVLTIYAAPGLGKTSLAFTANKTLMLDFDKGAHRAATRGDSVQVSAWADVALMTKEDLAPYSSVAIDTAGRALDSLAADIIAGNPKAGRSDGSLTLQGFGTLKSRFTQWQSYLRSMGKDIILICHMDEQKNGDDVMERIDAQGSSRNEIYKSSDAMCRIRLDNRDQRYLDFDPRQGGYGKNPAQLPKIPFPHPSQSADTLAQVIAQIKSAMNRQSAEQSEALKEQEEWQGAVSQASTVNEINNLVSLAKERKLSPAFKVVLNDRAKELSLAFDKASGKYAEAK